MSLNAFSRSRQGKTIDTILRTREAIDRMEAFSAAGRPALQAIADRIAEVAPSLSDTEKQHVGRYVHRVLGPRGWRPVDKKRLPKGSLFTTAAVYARADAPVESEGLPSEPDGTRQRREAVARLEAAREILRPFPIKSISVERFIADKRREAKRELQEYK